MASGVSRDRWAEWLSENRIPLGDYDYLIYGEDTNGDGVADIIYAKNGRTGKIELKGTDAASVIQQANDALTNGGIIFIMQGVYNIRSTIYLNNGITINGAGYKTALQQTNTIDIFHIEDKHNVVIRNMRLVGTGSNTAIYAKSVSEISLENLFIDNFYNGIVLDGYENGVGGGCWRNMIVNSVIKNCNKAIVGYDAADTHIINNYIYGATKTDAIYLYGYTWGKNGGNIIVGNMITNILRPLYLYYQVATEITGNIFDYYSSQATIDNSQKINISTCWFDMSNQGTTQNALLVKSSSAINISNTTFRRATGQGLYIYLSQDINVSNSFFELNAYNGVTFDTCTNGSINGVISKNNGAYGIRIKNSTDIQVIGNNCYDDQTTKTQDYGIYEDGTSDYNIIVGNNCRGNLTGGINTVGANTIASNNIT